jgi:hypothetical protein
MAVTGLAVTIGIILVLGTWLSVLRTVFTLQERASLLSRLVASVMGALILSLAHWVPESVREYTLGLATPLILFGTGIVWLVADATGFALLTRAIYRAPVNVAALACLVTLCSPAPRPSQVPIVAVAWLSTLLILAAFIVYLVRVTSAYSRREQILARLSAEATRTSDAETVLGEYLAGGGRSHLAAMLGEWADWFADVQLTHLAYPALIYSRSPNGRCWTGAAQIMLDCAALSKACAPGWAPPQAGLLLAVGTRCLPRVAARLGIQLPAVPVSYQGRESQPFTGTFRKICAAGLPMEVSEDRAQSAFQQLRVQYAPFANAICERLQFEYADL